MDKRALVGLVFYFLGGKTRQEVVTEPITAVSGPVGDAEQAP
jgi:hypothetical protein